MNEYEVKQIDDLFRIDMKRLMQQSKEEGFRFVERLVKEYESGTNTFNDCGEVLLGVFNEKGETVAIGGLNKDPFSIDPSIGRLRRFYVSNEYRRTGVGSLLVKRIMNEAKEYYKLLVLHTDTEQGADFYRSIGFLKGSLYPNSTHYMEL